MYERDLMQSVPDSELREEVVSVTGEQLSVAVGSPASGNDEGLHPR